jgi:hypothetical protein
MDRDMLIITIVGIACVLLFVLALFWFANSSTKRVASRRFSGRYEGPTNQYGCASPQIGDCPPVPGPGCVPAKLIQQCDQYVAVRVPASACGCNGSSSDFHADLQMMADVMAEQQAADRRDQFFAAQERLLAKRKG